QLRLRGGPGRRPRPGPGPGRGQPDAGARGRDPGVGARDRRHRPQPGGPGAGRAHARAHRRLRGRDDLQPPGQGAARLVAGHLVLRGRAPVSRLAGRGNLGEGTDMRSAVLLSGALGMGHDVMAEACATTLGAYGWSTETLDAMRLLGKRGSRAGEAVFRGMLAVPGLFDAFHFSALRPGSRLALLTNGAARRRIVPRLRAYLDEHPADLAISVFATGASAVSTLAERYLSMTHVVFCTDVTPHRLWVHPHVDLYLVTSVVAEAAV